MTKSRYAIECAKLVFAYLLTFGVLLSPFAIVIALIYRYWGTEQWWIGPLSVFGLIFMLPLSAYVSRNLANWFLSNWAKPYLK